MDYLNAFLCGGILCAIGQILIDKTQLTPARRSSSVTDASVSSGFSQLRSVTAYSFSCSGDIFIGLSPISDQNLCFEVYINFSSSTSKRCT